MAQRCIPAPFLMKTYKMVDDPVTDDVISWNENGTSFVVWKIGDFAKDLLPNYFKHDNFSSFVRQLNTYGFRKIVQDKWEFANENFKQGKKELLTEIYRRKAVTPMPNNTSTKGKTSGDGPNNTSTKGKTSGDGPNNTSTKGKTSGDGPNNTSTKGKTSGDGPNNTSTKGKTSGDGPNKSGEDLGSTSISKNLGSFETKPTITIQYYGLSHENKKLKKQNEMLSSKLVQAKKQCHELVAFVTECVNTKPDHINHIMRQGSYDSTRDGDDHGRWNSATDLYDHDEDDDEIYNGNLKLFGVLLKGAGKKRRK